jgi:hypothetical protein
MRIDMKKILLILLICKIGYSQTIQELDERLKRVEDSLGITTEIVIDTTLSKPVYEGIILSSVNADILPIPYSPIQYNNGAYKLFVQKNNVCYILSSANGLNGWSYSLPLPIPYGTAMFTNENKINVAFHKWYSGKSYYYFSVSPDQRNFYDVSFIRDPHGEDITYIFDGVYKAYARMEVPPAVRTIGYMESNDFRTWSNLVEVLKPDVSDGVNQFYSMSVVKTERGYFGLLNVFNPVTDLVSVQLVFSLNGKDNWQRLNNRNDFLEKKNGVKCLYGIASVINSELQIVTISSKFSHSETDRNGRYYFTEKYKISLTELYKYL